MHAAWVVLSWAIMLAWHWLQVQEPEDGLLPASRMVTSIPADAQQETMRVSASSHFFGDARLACQDNAAEEMHWLGPLLGFPPAQDMDISGGQLGAASLAISGVDALRQLKRLGAQLDGVVINIGAGDACNWDPPSDDDGALVYHCDPVNEAFELTDEFPRLRGVLIEPDANSVRELRKVIGANPNVEILHAAANYTTLEATMRRVRARGWRAAAPSTAVPEVDVEYVKTDIDAWDCEMIEFLLRRGLRPRIWEVEINPIFPPPLRHVYFGQAMPTYVRLNPRKNGSADVRWNVR